MDTCTSWSFNLTKDVSKKCLALAQIQIWSLQRVAMSVLARGRPRASQLPSPCWSGVCLILMAKKEEPGKWALPFPSYLTCPSNTPTKKGWRFKRISHWLERPFQKGVWESLEPSKRAVGEMHTHLHGQVWVFWSFASWHDFVATASPPAQVGSLRGLFCQKETTAGAALRQILGGLSCSMRLSGERVKTLFKHHKWLSD